MYTEYTPNILFKNHGNTTLLIHVITGYLPDTELIELKKKEHKDDGKSHKKSNDSPVTFCHKHSYVLS